MSPPVTLPQGTRCPRCHCLRRDTQLGAGGCWHEGLVARVAPGGWHSPGDQDVGQSHLSPNAWVPCSESQSLSPVWGSWGRAEVTGRSVYRDTRGVPSSPQQQSQRWMVAPWHQARGQRCPQRRQGAGLCPCPVPRGRPRSRCRRRGQTKQSPAWRRSLTPLSPRLLPFLPPCQSLDAAFQSLGKSLGRRQTQQTAGPWCLSGSGREPGCPARAPRVSPLPGSSKMPSQYGDTARRTGETPRSPPG